jgi:hypothetical protein
MTFQLPIRIPTCERPVDPVAGGVTPLLPRGHLGGQGGGFGGTAGQALALQNADFDLGHVQPAGMCGCVVELDSAQQYRRRLEPQHFLKTLAHMRVEVIQDQVHLANLGIAAAQQAADESDKIDLGAPGGDLDEATLTARFDGDKEVAGTSPLVLVVVFGRCAGLRGQGAARLAQQLLAFLVQADHRLARIVGRAYRSSSSYMRLRYSAVSSPMHHISLHQGLRRFFLESGGWFLG